MDKKSPDRNKNYDLKSRAVEDLTDSDNIPEYSQEELNRYRTKSGFHVPNWLKVIALKAWFAGAVCYFVLWGLGMYLPELEQIVVLAVTIGMAIDLLLNNVLRFIEKIPGENSKWLFVTKKGVLGFVLNLFYGALLVYCTYSTYVGINEFLNIAYATEGKNYIGVEPLLFGLLCMAFDMLFIAIKRLLGRIISDAKQAAGNP